MNYCVDENGMNEPQTIRPDQVTFEPQPDQTTPPGNINPTVNTPGLTYTTEMTPKINVTLDQPATLTLIYVPIDRPNEPSNVKEFTVVFVFPNGTTPSFSSSSAGVTTTTTTPSGLPSSTTPTATGVQPPSSVSPQVDLPPNFQLPEGTVIIIMITLTTDFAPPTGVRIILVLSVFCLFENTLRISYEGCG